MARHTVAQPLPNGTGGLTGAATEIARTVHSRHLVLLSLPKVAFDERLHLHTPDMHSFQADALIEFA